MPEKTIDPHNVTPSWVTHSCGHPSLSTTINGYNKYLACAICEVDRLMKIVEAAQAVDAAWDADTGAVVAGHPLLNLRKSLNEYEENHAREK